MTKATVTKEKKTDKAKVTAKAAALPSGPAVIVTTEHRGVFFGYLESKTETTAVLTQVRNCLYWSRKVKGFIGLAATGPDKDCRVGPAAPRMDINKVTSITECSEEAIHNWEQGFWG